MNIETLQKALAAYFNVPDVESYNVMSYGRENTSVKVVLHTGQNLILRVWGEAHSHMGMRKQTDIAGELAFMRRCYDYGVPVPKLHQSLAGNWYEQLPTGENYAVMDYVAGESPRNLAPDMVRQTARAMAHMHQAVADFNFPEPRSWPGTLIEMTNQRLEKIPTVQGLDSTVCAHIQAVALVYAGELKTIDIAALPAGPIHGDIMWENMKFIDGKLAGIFDFDDCRTSYFLEDIVKTLLFDFDDPVHCFFGSNGDNVKTFLEAYGSVRPLTPQEHVALPLFLTAGYLYRITAFINKLAGGNAKYQPRIAALMSRYVDNREFFLLDDA